VNKSAYLTTVYGKEVFAGFIHIQNLDEKTGKIIPEEKKANGDFLSLEDFVERISPGIETLSLLIFSGALRFTGLSKNELILRARMLVAKQKDAPAMTLLREPTRHYKLPELKRSPFEDAFDEIELLGFPLSCSPFDLLETKYRGDVKVKDLLLHGGKTVRMVGYLICRKHVPTSQGMMNFGTWIDDEGEYFDSTHFAACLTKFPFEGGGCYLLLGKVDVDFSFPSLIVEKMARLPFVPDPRYEDDKDMRYRAHRQIREDISATHRAPYPSEAEIGLPRYSMKP
jgi:DNA polymerase III alpha subunit